MVPKVALDTNILLDVLLKGRPHKAEAEIILSAAAAGRIAAQVTTQSIIDAAYTSRKCGIDYTTFVETITSLRSCLAISAVDWMDMSWSFSSPDFVSSGDFEDDAQLANAYNSLCDYFITRDKKLLSLNKADSPLVIVSPEEFVSAMGCAG